MADLIARAKYLSLPDQGGRRDAHADLFAQLASALERCRKALEPFARMAERYRVDTRQDQERAAANITVQFAWLREARATLQSLQEGSDGPSR